MPDSQFKLEDLDINQIIIDNGSTIDFNALIDSLNSSNDISNLAKPEVISKIKSGGYNLNSGSSPSSDDQSYIEILCKIGYTAKDIAKLSGGSEDTIESYIKEHDLKIANTKAKLVDVYPTKSPKVIQGFKDGKSDDAIASEVDLPVQIIKAFRTQRKATKLGKAGKATAATGGAIAVIGTLAYLGKHPEQAAKAGQMIKQAAGKVSSSTGKVSAGIANNKAKLVDSLKNEGVKATAGKVTSKVASGSKSAAASVKAAAGKVNKEAITSASKSAAESVKTAASKVNKDSMKKVGGEVASTFKPKNLAEGLTNAGKMTGEAVGKTGKVIANKAVDHANVIKSANGIGKVKVIGGDVVKAGIATSTVGGAVKAASSIRKEEKEYYANQAE